MASTSQFLISERGATLSTSPSNILRMLLRNTFVVRSLINQQRSGKRKRTFSQIGVPKRFEYRSPDLNLGTFLFHIPTPFDGFPNRRSIVAREHAEVGPDCRAEICNRLKIAMAGFG